MLYHVAPVVLLLLAATLVHLLRTYFRLRHVPGPYLASLSNLWRLYTMNVPGHGERMVALHREHGPLVRIGPNRVSTSDASMISVVFATTEVWEKVSKPRTHMSRREMLMTNERLHPTGHHPPSATAKPCPASLP